MRLSFIATAAALAITGCASSTAVQGPNGTAYSVSCPPANIELCYAEASKQCPSGYQILSAGDRGVGVMQRMGTSYVLARGRNQMLVECKAKP